MGNESSKTIFLNALLSQPVPRPPVWYMRQSGRHMKAYKDIRSKFYSFKDMCRQPDVITQLALLPMENYSVDAAIVFSDILLLPDAMGYHLDFCNKQGPTFLNSIASIEDLEQAVVPNIYKKLGFVGDSITQLRRHFKGKKAVIGFAGAPWTLACYLVEGSLSKQKVHIRNMLYTQPKLLTKLLAKLTQATIDYLCMQVESGADALMLFDSHADILTPAMYSQYSVSYMQTIIEGVRSSHKKIPFIIYSKSSLCSISKVAQHTDVNCISIPWQIEMSQARQMLEKRPIALQGNLDPALLYADNATIEAAIKSLVQSHPQPGLIVNLGHGMLPDVSPEKVKFAAQVVADMSACHAEA